MQFLGGEQGTGSAVTSSCLRLFSRCFYRVGILFALVPYATMLQSTSCFCFPYNMITVVDFICAWFMVFLFLCTIKIISLLKRKDTPQVIMAQLCSDNELQYILGFVLIEMLNSC